MIFEEKRLFNKKFIVLVCIIVLYPILLNISLYVIKNYDLCIAISLIYFIFYFLIAKNAEKVLNYINN
jgi:hypothetical protein